MNENEIGFTILFVMLFTLYLFWIHGHQNDYKNYYDYNYKIKSVKPKRIHKRKKRNNDIEPMRDKYYEYINACWDEIENRHE